MTPEDLVNVILKAALEGGSEDYVIFDRSFDWEVNLEGGKDSSRCIDRARNAVGPLTQTFEVALRAKRAKRLVSGYDEGEADGSILAAFSLGAVPVDEMWMQEVAEDDRDVVAALLVDCSGSMGTGPGSKSDHAQVAAAAFSQALSAVQIQHEVLAFTAVSSHGYDRHAWVTEARAQDHLAKSFVAMAIALEEQESRGISALSFARECYRGSRQKLLVPAHAVLKSFGSTDLSGLRHISGVHENLDGEAVLWAAKRLAQRPEARRVLIVLSDGLPAGARVPDGGSAYLSKIVQEAIAAGIEVIGVGIESEAVTQFYPHHVVVRGLEDLPRAAVEELVTLLLTSRQEQDEVIL
jgi:cobaltochelatase CobT